MEAQLEQLTNAIDVLTALDIDALTDTELHTAVIGMQRLGDRLTVIAAPLLQRWHHRQVWATDGSKSAAARLSRETGTAKKTAARSLHRASALATMPATSAAGSAGELSLDQVDLLARANTSERCDLFARDEAMLVGQVHDLWFHEAVRIVRYWENRADAHLGRDHAAADQHQADAHAHCSTTLDGMVKIDAELDPVGGAIYTTELQRLVKELQEADRVAGVERTPAQRRAAAMVEMARRSAAMPADAVQPRPLFIAHVGDGAVAELCELANGTIITPAHLAPFCDDAMLEVILFDGPTTMVSVSKQRSFAGALRRAIEARDRHCQHPSLCDVPADQCDVDHIIPWVDGGPTSQHNGRLQCPTHNRNRDKHDHGATPFPARDITRDDEQRARRRWRCKRRGWTVIELHIDDLPDLTHLPETG